MVKPKFYRKKKWTYFDFVVRWLLVIRWSQVDPSIGSLGVGSCPKPTYPALGWKPSVGLAQCVLDLLSSKQLGFALMERSSSSPWCVIKCRRVGGWYQAWGHCVPFEWGGGRTPKKDLEENWASVLPVCLFLWSTVSYPTALSGQGTALDLGIDDLASRRNCKQKTIYLGPQVSLELGFHFRGTRLLSDSWRQGWRFGYSLVLYCFACVLCLYVCLQTTSVLHWPSLPSFKAQSKSLWITGPWVIHRA